MMCVIILLGLDAWWHIWEYKERKHLNDCWNHLFNDKLNSDRRYIDLIKKIVENSNETNPV